MYIIIASFLGFFSIFLGALTEHMLKPNISTEEFRFLITAIRYNQIHAVLMIILAFFINLNIIQGKKLLKLIFFMFLFGILFFSFSIYISIIFKLKYVIFLTPIGGTLLMGSWLMLAYYGFKNKV